ncbi:UbiD family decarboxylase [Chloroflexota bacterium]
MAYRSLREWIVKIEEVGQLKRINAEVDWNIELSAITKRVAKQEGPALLFENIKGYQNKTCRQVFMNGMGSRERVAMALGLPMESSYREITEHAKEKLGQTINPIIVSSGPVKENIMKGGAVDLYEFPVPKYMELDGGRYINTRGCLVTMDPDTKVMNVGMYRGMIGDDKKSIPVLLLRSQHWGHHYTKYEQQGQEMPVAVVYGWDPTILVCASTPIVHPGSSEYEVMGGLRGEPVELVKCETSDLYVPATAEIVIEGRISPNPKDFQMEGPFGEYAGFYGGPAEPRQVIKVDCITYRDNPIFRGGLNASDPNGLIEVSHWIAPFKSAVVWRALEYCGLENILGVWGDPISQLANLRVQIRQIYRGQAKQIPAVIWGVSNLGASLGKNIIVVDEDIDVFNDSEVDWAFAYRTNADMDDIQFFKHTRATALDPSIPLWQRDVRKYGAGKNTRVFIDATVNWDLEPLEQYGGRREPPRCTEFSPEVIELIDRRWHEYGF